MHHNVEYPDNFIEQPVRELLRQSQTNVTPDAVKGLQYAAAAFDIAQQPDVQAADPTAAGEAAAKAGLRIEQSGAPASEVTAWFDKSYSALQVDDPRFKRERAATHLLEGRTLALRLVRAGLAAHLTAKYQPDTLTVRRASQSFAEGEALLQEQHKPFGPWDPYAPMLSSHRAVHEAVHGDAKLAASIALTGIARAARAKDEATNFRAPKELPAHFKRQARFVGKQASKNLIGLGLAVTAPAAKQSRIQKVRLRTAERVLG